MPDSKLKEELYNLRKKLSEESAEPRGIPEQVTESDVSTWVDRWASPGNSPYRDELALTMLFPEESGRAEKLLDNNLSKMIEDMKRDGLGGRCIQMCDIKRHLENAHAFIRPVAGELWSDFREKVAKRTDELMEKLRSRISVVCAACAGYCCTCVATGGRCGIGGDVQLPTQASMCLDFKDGRCSIYEKRSYACQNFVCACAAFRNRPPTKEEYLDNYWATKSENLADFHQKMVEQCRAHPDIIAPFLETVSELSKYLVQFKNGRVDEQQPEEAIIHRTLVFEIADALAAAYDKK